MRTSESLMTLIALAISLCISLTLILGNFSLMLSLQLLQSGRVHVGAYLLILLLTAINGGALLWLFRRFRAARQGQVTPIPKPSYSYQEQREHVRVMLLERTKNQPFSLEEAVKLTGLEQLELSYLLDDMVHQGLLRTVLSDDGFVYHVVTSAPKSDLPGTYR